MKKTHERITVYQYKKSKRTIGIVKFGRGFFIFNVDLKTKSLSSLKYQKYFKRDSLHPTSYVVDVLKIIDGDSIRIEDPIFLEKSDLELDKWTHPTPLPDLPVRHFKELSKEELHWAGKRDGNVADRAFGYLITLALIIIAITTYHDLAILAAVIAVIAILTSNPVTGWKCSTKPDESLLHEIKEYKASLSHNDYVSKNFLDDTLKDFNNWKKLSPYQFEIAVTKLLNQQNYKVEVTQASNDGGIDIEGFTPSGRAVIVQVKQYKSNVGVAVVREMIGVRNQLNPQPITMIYTLNGFTKGAIDLANKEDIKLYSISEELFGV